MRTYDKLIATIFARQATRDLRSFLGVQLAVVLGLVFAKTASASTQEFG